MDCDVLVKGTQVDGVYDCDPNINENASRYKELSYQKVLTDNLRVMDSAAITLMRDNDIPIVVFSLKQKGSFDLVMQGLGTCTTIKS